MLTKRQMEKYADVLLWGLQTAKKKPLKKNDIILVRFGYRALKLAEILQGKLLDKGFNPVIRIATNPVMERQFFDKADNRQLVFIAPGEEELFRALNGSITIHAPESLTHLSRVNPKRIGKAAVVRKPLRDILDKKEEQGNFSWTLCIYPTAELAQKAGLSESDYAKQIVKACYLDNPKPVEAWNRIYRKATAIKKWLNGLNIEALRIESQNTDLKVVPGKKRRWVGISGHNIPSFELFLSPDANKTEGTYYADQPSYRSGNYVEGVRLTLKKGRVVQVKAKKGKPFIEKQITMDRGAARVGEFSLTDRRFSKIDRFMANTLFDENHGGRYGNCHLALGSSYSDTYDGDPARLTKDRKKRLGFNDSALHWDLVNTEKKRVTAFLKGGGEVVIYENGRFKTK